jgi:hypothetical protein
MVVGGRTIKARIMIMIMLLCQQQYEGISSGASTQDLLRLREIA